MSLDASKLNNLKHYGSITIAQCPACTEEGRDHKGDHLFIRSDGRFGCVRYPGEAGYPHRSRIFELVGIKEHGDPANIKIKEVKCIESPEVIESNVLGRLGRVKVSQNIIGDKKEVKIVNKEAIAVTKVETDVKIPVPIVPDSCSYTVEELRLIQSEDEDTLRLIHSAKVIFGGTVLPPEPLDTGKRLGVKTKTTVGKQVGSDSQNTHQSIWLKVDKAK